MAARPPFGFHRKQRGLTLIEQIMVLAIIAILVGIAVPPLHQLVARNQLRVAQTDFIVALHHARATAITSGRRTLFCPSTDGHRCSNDTHWDSGWLLGHDADHDEQPDHGPLYVGDGYRGSVNIRSSVGRHLVRFSPDGTAGGSNLTLLFCQPAHAQQALSVVVSNSGRIRGAPATAAQIATCAQTR
jgi:type IV fimbrial biogenesis protein FimT